MRKREGPRVEPRGTPDGTAKHPIWLYRITVNPVLQEMASKIYYQGDRGNACIYAEYYSKFVQCFVRIAKPIFQNALDERVPMDGPDANGFKSTIQALPQRWGPEKPPCRSEWNRNWWSMHRRIRSGIPERQRHLIICISRKWSNAESYYSQKQGVAFLCSGRWSNFTNACLRVRFRFIMDYKALQYLTIMQPDSYLVRYTFYNAWRFPTTTPSITGQECKSLKWMFFSNMLKMSPRRRKSLILLWTINPLTSHWA